MPPGFMANEGQGTRNTSSNSHTFSFDSPRLNDGCFSNRGGFDSNGFMFSSMGKTLLNSENLGLGRSTSRTSDGEFKYGCFSSTNSFSVGNTSFAKNTHTGRSKPRLTKLSKNPSTFKGKFPAENRGESSGLNPLKQTVGAEKFGVLSQPEETQSSISSGSYAFHNNDHHKAKSFGKANGTVESGSSEFVFKQDVESPYVESAPKPMFVPSVSAARLQEVSKQNPAMAGVVSEELEASLKSGMAEETNGNNVQSVLSSKFMPVQNDQSRSSIRDFLKENEELRTRIRNWRPYSDDKGMERPTWEFLFEGIAKEGSYAKGTNGGRANVPVNADGSTGNPKIPSFSFANNAFAPASTGNPTNAASSGTSIPLLFGEGAATNYCMSSEFLQEMKLRDHIKDWNPFGDGSKQRDSHSFKNDEHQNSRNSTRRGDHFEKFSSIEEPFEPEIRGGQVPDMNGKDVDPSYSKKVLEDKKVPFQQSFVFASTSQPKSMTKCRSKHNFHAGVHSNNSSQKAEGTCDPLLSSPTKCSDSNIAEENLGEKAKKFFNKADVSAIPESLSQSCETDSKGSVSSDNAFDIKTDNLNSSKFLFNEGKFGNSSKSTFPCGSFKETCNAAPSDRYSCPGDTEKPHGEGTVFENERANGDDSWPYMQSLSSSYFEKFSSIEVPFEPEIRGGQVPDMNGKDVDPSCSKKVLEDKKVPFQQSFVFASTSQPKSMTKCRSKHNFHAGVHSNNSSQKAEGTCDPLLSSPTKCSDSNIAEENLVEKAKKFFNQADVSAIPESLSQSCKTDSKGSVSSDNAFDIKTDNLNSSKFLFNEGKFGNSSKSTFPCGSFKETCNAAPSDRYSCPGDTEKPHGEGTVFENEQANGDDSWPYMQSLSSSYFEKFSSIEVPFEPEIRGGQVPDMNGKDVDPSCSKKVLEDKKVPFQQSFVFASTSQPKSMTKCRSKHNFHAGVHSNNSSQKAEGTCDPLLSSPTKCSDSNIAEENLVEKAKKFFNKADVSAIPESLPQSCETDSKGSVSSDNAFDIKTDNLNSSKFLFNEGKFGNSSKSTFPCGSFKETCNTAPSDRYSCPGDTEKPHGEGTVFENEQANGDDSWPYMQSLSSSLDQVFEFHASNIPKQSSVSRKKKGKAHVPSFIRHKNVKPSTITKSKTRMTSPYPANRSEEGSPMDFSPYSETVINNESTFDSKGMSDGGQSSKTAFPLDDQETFYTTETPEMEAKVEELRAAASKLHIGTNNTGTFENNTEEQRPGGEKCQASSNVMHTEAAIHDDYSQNEDKYEEVSLPNSESEWFKARMEQVKIKDNNTTETATFEKNNTNQQFTFAASFSKTASSSNRHRFRRRQQSNNVESLHVSDTPTKLESTASSFVFHVEVRQQDTERMDSKKFGKEGSYEVAERVSNVGSSSDASQETPENVDTASAMKLMCEETKKACEEWRCLGNQAYAIGDFPRAEDYYSKGANVVFPIETPQQCIRASMLCYSNCAATRMALGRWREALADCKQAMAIDPKFLRVQIRAASCHLGLGENEEAIIIFKECLRSAKEIDTLDLKIASEASEGFKKAEQGLEYCEHAAKLMNTKSTADMINALCMLTEALSLSPYSEQLLQIKVSSLLFLRRYDEAIQVCEQSLDFAEKNCATANLHNNQQIDDPNEGLAKAFSQLWRWHMCAKSHFYMGRLEEAQSLLVKYENVNLSLQRLGMKSMESLAVFMDKVHNLLQHKVSL